MFGSKECKIRFDNIVDGGKEIVRINKAAVLQQIGKSSENGLQPLPDPFVNEGLGKMIWSHLIMNQYT